MIYLKGGGITVKPTIQYGSMFEFNKSSSERFGLIAGVISGKAIFNDSERPRFIEALRDIILCKLIIVKCSFFINQRNYLCK